MGEETLEDVMDSSSRSNDPWWNTAQDFQLPYMYLGLWNDCELSQSKIQYKIQKELIKKKIKMSTKMVKYDK